MADDYYSLLGIPSPEAEEVQRLLQPSGPAERTYQADPFRQRLDDLGREYDASRQERENTALQGEIQRRINLPTALGKGARNAAWQQAMEQAMYEKQAKSLIEDLQLLDPADPEALDQQDEVVAKHPIARKAMSDPRVASLIRRQSKEHEEMRKVFDDDPDALAEYTQLRADGLPPKAVRQQVLNNAKRRAERLWFASNGGNPDDFDSGKFNGPDGKPDKAKMAHFLSTQKAQGDSLLSSTERKALDQAADNFSALADLNPDDEETKRREFMAKFGRPPKTEQEWTSARNMVIQAGLSEKEALAALILDFERAGKRVPDLYKKMIGASVPQDSSVQNGSGSTPDDQQETTENQQRSTTSQGPPKPVMVRTKSDYDSLPSGTRYLDGSGNIKIKK